MMKMATAKKASAATFMIAATVFFVTGHAQAQDAAELFLAAR
jgi:hypothetical protein